MNLWILRGETSDGKGFEFLNAIRDHDPLILDHNQIWKFDAPDKLLLLWPGSSVRLKQKWSLIQS